MSTSNVRHRPSPRAVDCWAPLLANCRVHQVLGRFVPINYMWNLFLTFPVDSQELLLSVSMAVLSWPHSPKLEHEHHAGAWAASGQQIPTEPSLAMWSIGQWIAQWNVGSLVCIVLWMGWTTVWLQADSNPTSNSATWFDTVSKRMQFPCHPTLGITEKENQATFWLEKCRWHFYLPFRDIKSFR